MNIDRTIAKTLSDECKLALQAVATKHGLELIRKSGNYSSAELNMRFQLRSTETDMMATRLLRESEDFKRFAAVYGLSSDDLGREFRSLRGRYKITGLVSRRPKYPIQAVCLRTGKGFKFPADIVQRALANEGK